MDKPKFTNHCGHHIFISHWKGKDLYLLPPTKTNPTLGYCARASDEPWDYASGLFPSLIGRLGFGVTIPASDYTKHLQDRAELASIIWTHAVRRNMLVIQEENYI